MDRKISQFPANTTVLATDLIPIVSGGLNASVTAGIFSLNQPNVGNRGLSKDVAVTAAPGALALTSTVFKLAGAYTVGAGADGQYIELVALSTSTVTVAGFGFTTINIPSGIVVGLRHFTGSGWFVTNNTGASIA